MQQVLLKNFVQVLAVDVRVPDLFRVDTLSYCLAR